LNNIRKNINHGFLPIANHYFYYEPQLDTDVCFLIETLKIYAHSEILQKRAGAFIPMFSKTFFTPCDVIRITDISPKAFEMILKVCTTHEQKKTNTCT